MEKSFLFNQTTISYTVTGSGTPVLLLHGFGEDSRIWKTQIEYLQECCQLLVPDLPGSGKSGILQLNEPSITDYAACINALLQKENINKCILLGHSMGGYIALAFAEKYPQHLIAFGLVHSTAFADSEEKKAIRKRGIEMMQEYGVYPFLKNTIPNLFTEKYKKDNPEPVAELINEGKNFTTEALCQYYTAMMNRPDLTDVLKTAKVPVLFVLGTEDVAAPLDDVLQQVYLPVVSEVHILKETGHMGMMEEPKKLNKYLSDFITFPGNLKGNT